MHRKHLTVRTHARIFLAAHSLRTHTWGPRFDESSCVPQKLFHLLSCLRSFDSVSSIFTASVTSLTTLTVSLALSTGRRPQPCATLEKELSGHLANSSPNTGYKPWLLEYKFCIDVDSEHTPINLPTRNMGFPQKYAATITGSEDLSLPRHPGASSSSQHSAASRIRTMSKLDELGTSLMKVTANRDFVVGSSSNKETCADMDRETTFFKSFRFCVKGAERSETKTLYKH